MGSPPALAAAVAVSTHPVTATATGEAAGQLLERGFAGADLLCCFVTAAHAGAMEDVAGALGALLQPAVLLGAASAGVLGGATMASRGPGLVLWAATGAAVRPWSPGSLRREPPAAHRRHPPASGRPAAGLVLLPDLAIGWLPDGGTRPLSDPPTGRYPDPRAGLYPDPPGLSGTGGEVGASEPGAQTAGGAAIAAAVTPAAAAGGPLLVLEGRIVRDAPVGVAFDPAWELRPSWTTGVRAIGPPVRVTETYGSLVAQLDGLPALARLERLARDEVPAPDARRINRGLVALVPAEGGSVAVPVAGADRVRGALALGAPADEPLAPGGYPEVAPGAIIRFGVTDPDATAGELRDLLRSEPSGGALVFPPSLGDGPVPWVPAEVPTALAGCASDGGFAPGGGNAVNRGVAAVACFRGIGSSPAVRKAL